MSRVSFRREKSGATCEASAVLQERGTDGEPERHGLAGGRLGGVLGDALGQHAQLAGVTDVFRIVVGLGIEVGEVGKQQHDEHDQCDEQHDDLRAAARAGLRPARRAARRR